MSECRGFVELFLKFFFRFWFFLFLLITSSCVFGRELSCSYYTRSEPMWPTYSYCFLSSVDLSKSYQSQYHTFSGTSAQKTATTAVYFYSSTNIDFVPEEVLSEFPLLNGLIFESYNLPTVKNDLFSKNFNSLQYLYLYSNKIQTIEANAFQYLIKLKWIRLDSNQIESLSLQIFKKNPEITYIDLRNNKINSIDSKFFKNLKNLKYVGFAGSNVCVSQDFGCSSSTCSASQSDLDSGLATCFSNCVKDLDCALRSGKIDLLNPRYVEQNIDSIVTYGHLDVLIKENYTDLLIKKGYLNLIVENGFLDLLVAQNYLDPLIQNGHLGLLIEKGYTDLLVEKGYKNKIIESDWRLKLAYKDMEKNMKETNNTIRNVEKPIYEIIEKYRNESSKSDANLLQEISQNSNEIKIVEKKFEEISAMFGSDLKVQQDKVGLLEKAVADLKENEKVEAKSLKITENFVENQTDLVQGSLSTELEKTKEEVKELKQLVLQQVSEAKLLMENERLKFKLDKQVMESDMKSLKQTTDFELKTMKQELVIMKLESERREAEIKALKDQLVKFEMSIRP
jgi:hypothetical protein